MAAQALRALAAEDMFVTGIVAGLISSKPGEVIHVRRRQHTQIHLCLSGARDYSVEGQPLAVIRPGDLLVMPAQSSYDTTVNGADTALGLNVLFYLKDGEGREIVLDSVPFVVRDEEGVYAPLLESVHEDYLKGGYAMLRAKGTLMHLLYRLFTQHTLATAGESYHAIAPAVQRIENSVCEKLSMDELATLCYMSRSTFYRRFKDAMGISPTAYHMNLKITKSRALLSSGLYTVEQVAALMGFYDAAHFSRVYRRETGSSPGGQRRG